MLSRQREEGKCAGYSWCSLLRSTDLYLGVVFLNQTYLSLPWVITTPLWWYKSFITWSFLGGLRHSFVQFVGNCEKSAENKSKSLLISLWPSRWERNSMCLILQTFCSSMEGQRGSVLMNGEWGIERVGKHEAMSCLLFKWLCIQSSVVIGLWDQEVC